MTKQKPISQQLAEKTFKELGLDPKTGKPIPTTSRKSPVDSHNLPFRIPALEKTKRQAASTTGYKASATWQTASLLRDLLTFRFTSLKPSPVDFPLFSRLKAQVLDASRSVVANIEEGWARPSTKEYLDFLGYSQASLAEVRGDLERMLTDGILPSATITSRIPPVTSGNSPVPKTLKSIGISTPSREFPYPPAKYRGNPGKYGSLKAKLREYTGKNVNPKDLTYEIFIELINKTDWLLKKAVRGLDEKIITDEKRKLDQVINNQLRKYW